MLQCQAKVSADYEWGEMHNNTVVLVLVGNRRVGKLATRRESAHWQVYITQSLF